MKNKKFILIRMLFFFAMLFSIYVSFDYEKSDQMTLAELNIEAIAGSDDDAGPDGTMCYQDNPTTECYREGWGKSDHDDIPRPPIVIYGTKVDIPW